MGFRDRLRGQLNVTDKIKLQAYLSDRLKAFAKDMPLYVERHGNNPRPSYIVTTTSDVANDDLDARLKLDAFMTEMERVFPVGIMEVEEVDTYADNPYESTNRPSSTVIGAMHFTVPAPEAMIHAEKNDRDNFLRVMLAMESTHHDRSPR